VSGTSGLQDDPVEEPRNMYIGVGTLVLVLVILAIIYFAKRV
jgi:hypothetical protein